MKVSKSIREHNQEKDIIADFTGAEGARGADRVGECAKCWKDVRQMEGPEGDSFCFEGDVCGQRPHKVIEMASTSMS